MIAIGVLLSSSQLYSLTSGDCELCCLGTNAGRLPPLVSVGMSASTDDGVIMSARRANLEDSYRTIVY